jgi:hypothetical protein
MHVPTRSTSVDCENVALAVLDDTAQPAWQGIYRVVSHCLPADDVLPGDAVHVTALSGQAGFAAIVREVDIAVV